MDKGKLFANAEKALAKNQIENAIEQFETILKIDAHDLKALSRMADLYLKKDDTEKAIEYLRRVGGTYKKDGFYSKAVAIYKRILKLDSVAAKEVLIYTHEELADLYAQLGLVSDAMGHFSVVVEYYDLNQDRNSLLNVLKKVSDLDPLNVESQLKLVELFLSENRKIEAHDAISRLESNVRERGQVSDLIRVYERGSELYPEDKVKLKELIKLYLQVGEPKRALGKLQHSFKANPKDTDVLELLSWTFRNLKQPEKAHTVDVELLKLYRQIGEDEKAKDLEKRMSNPEVADVSPPAEKVSGLIPGDQDGMDAAEALIAKTSVSAEERKIVSECDVYLKYGLAEKAYETLRSRLDDFPQSLVIRWKLKNTAFELKKVDEAGHALSEILLLSKSTQQNEWARLAAIELGRIDPSHPSLHGLDDFLDPAGRAKVANSPKKVAATAAAQASVPIEMPAVQELDLGDQEDVSIVVEDDANEESPFEEISVDEELVSEPVASTACIASEDPIEDSQTIQLDALELNDSVPEAAELDGSDILSESDFSDLELDDLGSQLKPTSSAKPKEAPVPATAEVVDEVSLEFDLSESAPAISIEDEATRVTPAAKAEPVNEEFEVKQALEEVEFFRSQGLIEEADRIFLDIKKKYPNYTGWNNAVTEMSKQKSKNPPATLKVESPTSAKSFELETLGTKVHFNLQQDDRSEDQDFIDLASELEAELNGEPEEKTSAPAEVKEVFKTFKQGVKASVTEDDWQTHLDLGIAYREMSLFEDAIEEFQLVSKLKEHTGVALYQMGITEMARGEWKSAEGFLSEALATAGIENHVRLTIEFDLAETLLKLSNKDGALQLFKDVEAKDPEFREVSERIRQIS